MSFKDNLVRARHAAKLTQAKVALALGVSDKAVSQWERGKTVPELEKIPLIAKTLRTTVGRLFDDQSGLSEDDRKVIEMLGTLMPDQKKTALRVLRAHFGESSE